ncbi:hypothetical protein D3C76_1562110 [compost metagenome]
MPLQMQQPTLLSLPTRNQLPLLECRRLGSETGQLVDAFGCLLEASDKQQGRAGQPDQLWRTEHQLLALLLMQT